MTDSSASRRGLVLALLILLAAVLIYWGVTKTARDAENIPRPIPGTAAGAELFRPWDSLSLATAQQQKRLIVLLVTDTRSQASRELAALAAQSGEWPPSGAVGITVDRRLRPDVALRYANEAAPFALVLLPTGEALAALEGAPSDWARTIAEVDRYWREHPEDIQARVVDFWREEERRASSARPPQKPDARDLATIDSAVLEFAAGVLADRDSNAGLWRIDITAYLRARASAAPRAESLLLAIHAARAERWQRLFDTAIAPVPPFGVAQLALEELQRRSSDPRAEARATAAADWLSGIVVPLTASETAALISLKRALGRPDADPAFPGSWLGFEAESELSLPHLADSGASLDGYLVDALAWLELLALGTTASDLARAERLADSMWHELWSPEAHALRDKPLRATLVREIARYPRVQLGKTALLLYELSDRTGHPRFRERADSCLAGFAPYAADAGSAAAYYGVGLVAAGPGR